MGKEKKTTPDPLDFELSASSLDDIIINARLRHKNMLCFVQPRRHRFRRCSLNTTTAASVSTLMAFWTNNTSPKLKSEAKKIG